MKRTRSSDSLAGGQELYGERLPPIMDAVEDEDDELFASRFPSAAGEKKRRLSGEQVKALEKNFEVENKLDPERKVRIAHELGLQPRQVAVWFQNRRARWKTKQLERDYAALKSSFDALVADCDSLRGDKTALLAEIEELKAKLGMTGAETEEESESKDPQAAVATAAAATYKDGSSDSDSSAVVFDENSPYRFGIALQPELGRRPEELQSLVFGGDFDFQQTADSRGQIRSLFAKEEHRFLVGEAHCSDLFSEQPNPAFSWYSSDHWS